MPLPYRTILQLAPETDLIQLAEQEVQGWLESRGKVDRKRRIGFVNGDFWEPGVHELGGGRTLSVARNDTLEDGSRSLLLRYVEPNDTGVWQVDTLAVDGTSSAGRHDVLLIEAARADDPAADGQVDPPVLVRQLLSREAVLDGVTPVTSEPRLSGADHIDDVFAAIVDSSRSVSVIVGAAFERDHIDKFRDLLKDLTTKLAGTSAVFLLTPEAVTQLNGLLPDSHRMQEGRVRTYLPQVDLSDPADGARHRVLGPQTFARAIRGRRVAPYLQSAFAIQTRTALLATPVPRAVRRHRQFLEDAISQFARATAIEQRVEEVRAESRRASVALPTSPGPDPLLDRVKLFLARWLHREVLEVEPGHLDEISARIERAELSVEAVNADLRKTQAGASALKELREELSEAFDYRGLELADAEKTATRLQDEVRLLRRELAKEGRSAHAESQSIEAIWSTPADLSELALTLTPGTDDHIVRERIVFTGDFDRVLDTQERDLNGLYVQRCWEFVRVLYDYAERKTAGLFAGNVHSYLQSDAHDGMRVPLTRHAPGETEATLGRWGHERVFSVPEDVHSDGEIAMLEHFKAGQENTFAPRLHYFDDTDSTGKIYIGYIGRHLTNTKTKNT